MKNKKIAVIGLGYVGLPVSVLFASKYRVIGYDINPKRVNELNNFKDETLEIKPKTLEKLINNNLIISNDLDSIKLVLKSFDSCLMVKEIRIVIGCGDYC